MKKQPSEVNPAPPELSPEPTFVLKARFWRLTHFFALGWWHSASLMVMAGLSGCGMIVAARVTQLPGSCFFSADAASWGRFTIQGQMYFYALHAWSGPTVKLLSLLDVSSSKPAWRSTGAKPEGQKFDKWTRWRGSPDRVTELLALESFCHEEFVNGVCQTAPVDCISLSLSHIHVLTFDRIELTDGANMVTCSLSMFRINPGMRRFIRCVPLWWL